MPPSSSNVILRRAEIADLATIASIIAHSPDDAASWTYPTWRDKATESTPIYIKKFSNLFKNPQFKIRVAQQDGAVVGYAVWVRTERTSEGQVERVSSTKEYDQDALEKKVASLTASYPSATLDQLFATTIILSRAAAIAALRRRQDANLCLCLPSYQLLVIGVSESHQGQGIGGALIREGTAIASAAVPDDESQRRNSDNVDSNNEGSDVCPIFVTGEGRGMRVYQKLGFHILEGTWAGFDKDGEEVRTPADVGEEGLEAAEMVWVPPGRSVVVKGVVYSGQ